MTTKQIRDRLQHCQHCPKARACPGLMAVALPGTKCPLPGEESKWGAVPLLESLQTRQMGDAVKTALAPVVALSDSLLGTDLQNCGGCEQRRVDWNRQVDGPGEKV